MSEQSMEQEGKEVTTVENSNEVAISDADLGNLMETLGQPFSDKEQLLASPFLKKEEGLARILTSLPNLDTPKKVIQYVDNVQYKMEGEDTYMPDKIVLTKKIDPKNPIFNIGKFRMGDNAKPQDSILFLPLLAHTSRIYWPEVYDPANKKFICSSTNGFRGYFAEPTPHTKECKDCNFKEWGCTKDGGIDPESRNKPLCRQSYNFIGVTPEFDGLYEMTIQGYCTAKNSYNAHNKLITLGRMMGLLPLQIDLPEEELANYRINQATLDSNSKWLNIKGEPIEKDAQIVSGGTIVEKSDNVLTKEQLIYSLIYMKLAIQFVEYRMDNFNKFLGRTSETSVADTAPQEEAATAEAEPEVSDVMDTEDMDDEAMAEGIAQQ